MVAQQAVHMVAQQAAQEGVHMSYGVRSIKDREPVLGRAVGLRIKECRGAQDQGQGAGVRVCHGAQGEGQGAGVRACREAQEQGQGAGVRACHGAQGAGVRACRGLRIESSILRALGVQLRTNPCRGFRV